MKTDGLSHPKTKRLCNHLDVPLYQAVGILECLFGFAATYADDGRVSKYKIEEIAAFLEWDRDPAELIDALVASGYLENHEGNLVIHDWFDHCADYVKKRIRRRVEANGDRWQTSTDNGGLPVLSSSFPSQSKTNKRELEKNIEQVFSLLRKCKGFKPPNRSTNRMKMVERLITMEGIDRVLLAIKRFPLPYKFSGLFVPHLTWFCDPGCIDDILDGRYHATALNADPQYPCTREHREAIQGLSLKIRSALAHLAEADDPAKKQKIQLLLDKLYRERESLEKKKDTGQATLPG